MKKVLLFTIIASFFLFETNAQETVSTTGGNYSGTTGTVCFTVGQTAYTTNIGSNGTMSQGVQQPYEFFVLSIIEPLEGLIDLSISPNPTSDLLKLKVSNLKMVDLNYELYDLSGKLLKKSKIVKDETSIEMITLAPSTYLLKVIENNKEIKTFKILKNK